LLYISIGVLRVVGGCFQTKQVVPPSVGCVWWTIIGVCEKALLGYEFCKKQKGGEAENGKSAQ